VCVYLHIYICIFIYIYMYVYISRHVHIYVYIFHTCIYIQTSIDISFKLIANLTTLIPEKLEGFYGTLPDHFYNLCLGVCPSILFMRLIEKFVSKCGLCSDSCLGTWFIFQVDLVDLFLFALIWYRTGVL